MILMNKFIKVIPLFQLWWGLSIGGASPAYLRRVGKIRLNLWKFLLFLSGNITRIANAVQSLCLVGSLWLLWFPNLLCFHKHSRFKLGTFGEWVTHWVASILDRESEGWLPEGENTLCFKSNAAAAAAASWTTKLENLHPCTLTELRDTGCFLGPRGPLGTPSFVRKSVRHAPKI